MFYIAICDDEKEICTQLENILQKMNFVFPEELEIEIFYSGEELCRFLEREHYFDLIFLDIELDVMNGVKTGQYIRNTLCDDMVQIIYISAKDSYAMELFDVRPLHFLIKPLKAEKVEELVAKAAHLSNKLNQIFKYKNGYHTCKKPVADIIYFESRNRKIIMETVNGTEIFYGKLKDVFAEVESCGFIYVHKSYLINYAHISEFRYDSLRMSNGIVLPISQSRRKEIRLMQCGDK